MVCERCYRFLEVGEHGLGLCPLEPRRAPVVRPDLIPGGMMIAHGICNPDGTPRRYDSHSEMRRAAAERGLVSWSEGWGEDASILKDARVHDDWLQSGEAKRQRAERDERRAQRKERMAREARQQ
jgi:hypothetical protein